MTTLEELRRKTELTRCPKCGEPLDILPCSRSHQTANDELLRACKAALALFAKNHAIERFNWGLSAIKKAEGTR